MPSYGLPIDNLYQEAYRIFADDDGLNLATPLEALNTPPMVSSGTNVRVRVRIANFDLGGTWKFLLEYRAKPYGGSYGAWGPVTGSGNVKIANSAGFNTDDATTRRLGGALTWVPGVGIDTVTSTNNITIGFESETEIEWNVNVAGGAGDTIDFRVVALSSSAPRWTGGDYTAYPLFYLVLAQVVITTGGGISFMSAVANLAKVGIAVGATHNEAYVAQALLNYRDVDIAPRLEKALVSPGRGSLAARRALQATHWVEGRITAELTPTVIPHLLKLLQYAPSSSGTGPYTHAFDIGGATVSNQFGTIAVSHSTGKHMVFAGLVANRLSVSAGADSNEAALLAADLIGTFEGLHDTEATILGSAAADADPPFAEALATIQMPSGTSVNHVASLNMDITLDRDLQRTLRGSVFARNVQPARAASVSGSMTLLFESDTDLMNFLVTSGTGAKMPGNTSNPNTTSLVLEWNNGATGTAQRIFRVTLPLVVFTAASHPVRVGDLVMLAVDFAALYDATTSRVAQIVVVNNTDSYANQTSKITGLSYTV